MGYKISKDGLRARLADAEESYCRVHDLFDCPYYHRDEEKEDA